VAQPPDHPSADLDEHRSPRRQPGPLRTHERRPQVADVPQARGDRLQGDRSRFPSASQTDFDFVRQLIENGEIPDDVTIEVLSQAREHLIRRTMESSRRRRVIVHIYNATSPVFRETVFGMSKDEVRQLAVDSVMLVKQLAAEQPETEFVLQYSPETFTATELDLPARCAMRWSPPGTRSRARR
jgi:hypothetical protein